MLRCGLLKQADEFYRRRRDNHLRSDCKTCANRSSADHYAANRAANRARMNHSHHVKRMLVINGYGGACACCGETEPAFLVLDHINGGGTAARKTQANPSLWRRLIDAGFPPGYQVLCANCNAAKERPGGCPHQR